MFATAAGTIKKFNLIEKDDKIVISLSGGPDSAALLFFLMEIRVKYNLLLYAVHVNHMLRGEEADNDAAFVKSLCEKNGIGFLCVNKNVPKIATDNKLTVEEAGRIARLEAIGEALSHFSAHKAATGHNKNDNAETLLMRLSRGTGSKGLSGISYKSCINGVRIIRPLIECSREQIEEYCAANSIRYVTDYTNSQTIYTRNKVRLELLPWLKENMNEDIINTLAATSEILREQTELMERLAAQAYRDSLVSEEDGAVRLCVKTFEQQDLALKRLIVREAMKKAGGTLNNVSKLHSDNILALSQKGTGKKISLPGKIICKTEYGCLVFGKETEVFGFDYELLPEKLVYIKEEGIYASFSESQMILKYKNLCTKMFKCDKILFKLNYRTRQNGDRIKLKSGTKKISDYFIDKKIPAEQRARAALIAEGSNVLSVLDVCDSEEVKHGEHQFFIQLWEVPNGES